MTKGLALFDFDGTITRRDTLFEITKYHKGQLHFIVGMMVLSPILLLTMFRVIGAKRGKQAVLAYFFKGMKLSEFQALCDAFADERIPSLVRETALSAIKSHIENEDRVLIVSASPEHWIKKWADSLGIELIATKLELSNNGTITGKILGENCKGPEKVRRIKETLDLKTYCPVTSYGDSSGDKEMLAIADISYYKPFRDKGY